MSKLHQKTSLWKHDTSEHALAGELDSFKASCEATKAQITTNSDPSTDFTEWLLNFTLPDLKCNL